jgi:hypothetical protein
MQHGQQRDGGGHMDAMPACKVAEFSGRGLTGSIGLKSDEPLSVPGHQRYEGELDSLRDV